MCGPANVARAQVRQIFSKCLLWRALNNVNKLEEYGFESSKAPKMGRKGVGGNITLETMTGRGPKIGYKQSIYSPHII